MKKKVMGFLTSAALVSLTAVFLYGGALASNAYDNYEINEPVLVEYVCECETESTVPMPRLRPQSPVRVSVE